MGELEDRLAGHVIQLLGTIISLRNVGDDAYNVSMFIEATGALRQSRCS